jgi:hypothetical protein
MMFTACTPMSVATVSISNSPTPSRMRISFQTVVLISGHDAGPESAEPGSYGASADGRLRTRRRGIYQQPG